MRKGLGFNTCGDVSGFIFHFHCFWKTLFNVPNCYYYFFQLPKAFFKNTDVLKIIQAEYSINHCTQAVRNLLCKGATQEKIREHCEAYVSTKGRYIPEGSPVSTEKTDKAFGLYLFIQGPNKRSVDCKWTFSHIYSIKIIDDRTIAGSLALVFLKPNNPRRLWFISLL